MTRRDLIQRVFLGGAVLVVAPSVLQNCTKIPGPNPGYDTGSPAGGTTVTPGKLELDLSLPDNSALKNAGGSRLVQNVIVINTGGTFSVLSNACTHAGCTVDYNSRSGDIECPCHGSVFSISGSIIQGPATSALRSYPSNLAGNILTITL